MKRISLAVLAAATLVAAFAAAPAMAQPYGGWDRDRGGHTTRSSASARYTPPGEHRRSRCWATDPPRMTMFPARAPWSRWT